MIIGAYGSLVFSVSSQKVSTFENLSLTATYNTETQEVIGSKPSTYKKGPGLDQLSYDVTLDQTLGIEVDAEINKWRDICKSGAAYHMNIGGRNITEFPLMLKSVDVTFKHLGPDGKTTKAVLSIKLEEFVRAGSAKNSSSASGSTAGGGVSDNVYKALFSPDASKIVSGPNVARAQAGGRQLA